MLKSDHRELRNSKVKLMWVGGWVGRWWYEMMTETVQISTLLIFWFIDRFIEIFIVVKIRPCQFNHHLYSCSNVHNTIYTL